MRALGPIASIRKAVFIDVAIVGYTNDIFIVIEISAIHPAKSRFFTFFRGKPLGS
jgi:hypothetical protein